MVLVGWSCVQEGREFGLKLELLYTTFTIWVKREGRERLGGSQGSEGGRHEEGGDKSGEEERKQRRKIED